MCSTDNTVPPLLKEATVPRLRNKAMVPLLHSKATAAGTVPLLLNRATADMVAGMVLPPGMETPVLAGSAAVHPLLPLPELTLSEYGL